MRELVGVAEGLDHQVGESLRVVEHFDSLIARRVGLPTLVRAAVLLTGCGVGVFDLEHNIAVRLDEAAQRTHLDELPDLAQSPWPRAELDARFGGWAWIERAPTDSDHVNDAIVLERLVHAVRITLDRTVGRGSVDDSGLVGLTVDPESPAKSRHAAAVRLGLSPSHPVHVVLARTDECQTFTDSAGSVTASLRSLRIWLVEHGAEMPSGGRIGVSAAHPIDSLPAAWVEAGTALCFARQDEVLQHSDLGSLATLANGPARTYPDVAALRDALSALGLDLETAEALDEHPSLRSAAAALGLHHSTVKHIVGRLERALNYSFATSLGRLRFATAVRLNRYSTASAELDLLTQLY